MAVTINATNTAVAANGSQVATLTNSNLTIAAGSNTVVVGLLNLFDTGTAPTTFTGTWNSVTVPVIGSRRETASAFTNVIFGLPAPATGNHSFVASWTNNASPELIVLAF